MKFLKELNHKGVVGVALEVRIQPNSAKNQIVGLHGDRLKIKIQSPPVDGKANECLIEFLCEILDTAKSRVHLLRGETSREKSIFLEGLNLAEVLRQLQKCCSALK
jgi:uncharacterized protein (TIGR00251 family)